MGFSLITHLETDAAQVDSYEILVVVERIAKLSVLTLALSVADTARLRKETRDVFSRILEPVQDITAAFRAATDA